MTSKILLLLGTLFWILLVTLCSAFFWDRYNTQIASADLTHLPKKSAAPLLSQDEARFVEEVPIHTLAEKNAAEAQSAAPAQRAPLAPPPSHPKHTDTSAATGKAEAPASAKHNISRATASSSEQAHKHHKAHAATRPSHILAGSEAKTPHTVETSEKGSLRSGKAAPLQRASSLKKPTRQSSSDRSGASKKSRSGIVIEPVVATKRLTVSRSGALFRWDRPYLHDLARRLKANSSLRVTLTALHPTAVQKRYMRHIRAFLIREGIDAERIELVTESEAQRTVVPLQRNRDQIELQLIERM